MNIELTNESKQVHDLPRGALSQSRQTYTEQTVLTWIASSLFAIFALVTYIDFDLWLLGLMILFGIWMIRQVFNLSTARSSHKKLKQKYETVRPKRADFELAMARRRRRTKIAAVIAIGSALAIIVLMVTAHHIGLASLYVSLGFAFVAFAISSIYAVESSEDTVHLMNDNKKRSQ